MGEEIFISENWWFVDLFASFQKGMKKVSGSCSMLVFGDVGFNDESDFEPVVFLMFHPCLVPLAKVWPFRRL